MIKIFYSPKSRKDLDRIYEESVINCEGTKNSIQSSKKILDNNMRMKARFKKDI